MKQHSKAQVEGTANSIMQHFIPKNPAETNFSFHFTIPPAANYKVEYVKDNKGKWILKGYESDTNL